MTPPDLDALQKLSDEAPNGPWSVHQRDEPHDAFYVLDANRRQVIHALRGNESRAAFIAAANPATIKALIAELKEARGLLQRWRSDLPTEALEDITDDFLARNGKGEG